MGGGMRSLYNVTFYLASWSHAPFGKGRVSVPCPMLLWGGVSFQGGSLCRGLCQGDPYQTETSAIFTARKRSLGQGNIFRSVCQEFCLKGACMHGGWGHAWPGGHACMGGGGMHGRGTCLAGGHACMGGHVWPGGCMPCTPPA